MKTTLNLNDRVLRKAKARAAREGITLTQFIEDAVKAKLLSTRKKRPYRFKPSIVTGNKPPNVDVSDRDALYDVIDNA
jgi:hypothetical protein